MSDIFKGPAIRVMYAQLVRDFGGVEAAAAFLGSTKGTISKETTGAMPVRTGHWGRLEDALQHWPITDMLDARRAPGRDGEATRRIPHVLRELGDVPAALFAYRETGDATPTLKEVNEAISALNAFRSAMGADDA
ncbi:MAG: hypothetical protein CML68_13645 [Rhodobacteraceae bacterium]|nr:hypothetical protein [Paracoccaceae bacterium]